MREIKFRAWDKKRKIWININDFCIENNKPHITNLEHDSEDKDLILLQFTGIKDKNRKEIYEGDILEVNNPMPEKRIVYWNDFNSGFETYKIVGKEKIKMSFHKNMRPKVIGNKFENPELLK